MQKIRRPVMSLAEQAREKIRQEELALQAFLKQMEVRSPSVVKVCACGRHTCWIGSQVLLYPDAYTTEACYRPQVRTKIPPRLGRLGLFGLLAAVSCAASPRTSR